ncbi:hypothetical protein HII12_004252 [Brettanomyces bruxellensis]|uniref:Cytochrome b2, mitochondrial n=1 Tax=Dekkera bruxellensis TaxID=5007 RepID=A0A8H6BB23_DEKBR|nr:hypothetical protein HII12_004252 [Brettanomyces bruxellensis]
MFTQSNRNLVALSIRKLSRKLARPGIGNFSSRVSTRSISSSKPYFSSSSDSNFHYTKWFVSSAIATAAAGAYLTYNLRQEAISNDSVSDAAGEPKRIIPVSEFIKHNKREDCWVAINGEVYDMTDFVPNHPGGQKVILQNAGYDATPIFAPIHPKGTIEKYLPEEKHLGRLDGKAPLKPKKADPNEDRRLDLLERMPLFLPFKMFMILNFWLRIFYQQVHGLTIHVVVMMRLDVADVDTSTTLLGTKASVPFYVSATALAKLGNPGGECSIARGAGKEGVIQMISTLSSNSLEEIAEARQPGATQWFQLYVNEDRNLAKELIRKAEKLGMKAIFVTVDAPSLGHREKDERAKGSVDTNLDLGEEVERESGASKALSSFIDCKVNWSDIKKIKEYTKLPVLVKGVQRVEDIVKAADCGCAGVVISNHGGRQLDTAPPPVEVLAEAVPILNRMEILKPGFEIFIDGGVRRGTDILKAIALGDQKVNVGVGLGRPFLYANAAYGEQGVRKAIRLLKDEMTIDMRLMGVTNLKQLNRNFLNLKKLYSGKEAIDSLYHSNYQKLVPVNFRESKAPVRKPN